VVEENTIVSEVAFGETSNGAAMVQGSFVGQGASKFRVFLLLFLAKSRSACTHERSIRE
jgi:hypothetical protein